MKKVVKKVVKKAAVKTKQASTSRIIKPASVELSPVHGTAGAVIPVPSARLFTNTRKDARIAFTEKK